MEWGKQKFLVELELKVIEIERESLSKWILFLQTSFLLSASATIGVFYKNSGKLNDWVIVGAIVSISLLADLLVNFLKINRLNSEAKKLLQSHKEEL